MTLSDNITTKITHTIKCDGCPNTDTIVGETGVSASSEFECIGWTATENYVLCPRCHKVGIVQ